MLTVFLVQRAVGMISINGRDNCKSTSESDEFQSPGDSGRYDLTKSRCFFLDSAQQPPLNTVTHLGMSPLKLAAYSTNKSSDWASSRERRVTSCYC